MLQVKIFHLTGINPLNIQVGGIVSTKEEFISFQKRLQSLHICQKIPVILGNDARQESVGGV